MSVSFCAQRHLNLRGRNLSPFHVGARTDPCCTTCLGMWCAQNYQVRPRNLTWSLDVQFQTFKPRHGRLVAKSPVVFFLSVSTMIATCNSYHHTHELALIAFCQLCRGKDKRKDALVLYELFTPHELLNASADVKRERILAFFLGRALSDWIAVEEGKTV